MKVSDKVMIPQEEHPDINFVGLLIGQYPPLPRWLQSSHKKIENQDDNQPYLMKSHIYKWDCLIKMMAKKADGY